MGRFEPAGLARSDLLRQALTHRSAGSRNNERLDFLGDSILDLVIAEELYRRFPNASEGDLSRLRARLVRRDTLANIARELKLGAQLVLGSGELKSGGKRRASILADALEAVLGAVFLDRGFDSCRGLVREWFAARLDSLPPAEELKDPKTRLQEFLQARQRALPRYRLVKAEGADHARTFHVRCEIDGVAEPTEASGSSLRRAEQECARLALDKIQGRT